MERLKNIAINFNDISEGKSPNYIRKLHTITNRKIIIKSWIKNTTNNNKIYNMDELIENN
ncbi:hypothetical protein KTC97_11800 [Clostridium estertheticum]|uniref:hypothetical protein n=1 Tax=Clostridium estertheticum TaxID=238834 RepID=UPI00271501D1|nr:hypothetical protein [Clostridium estertheticum]WLC82813.1 hypothetical protein KTC97_11800 [Clostridium estertheticum]